MARSEKGLFTGDAGGEKSGSRPEKETGDALVNPPFEKDRVNGKAPRRDGQGVGQYFGSDHAGTGFLTAETFARGEAEEKWA